MNNRIFFLSKEMELSTNGIKCLNKYKHLKKFRHNMAS